MTTKTPIDWEAIELHYRAGIKTVRQIGEEFKVSHTAIAKRAKRDDWTRDLEGKIKAKVADKVAKAAVATPVATETKVTDAAVVEANANIIASAELVQRQDILLGLSVSRGLLEEIAVLSRPDLSGVLVALGDAMDESGPTANGGWKTDKVNELYQYIISLAGRVKMAKETAATHGVYIPLQRKVLRMESEADKGASAVEDLLLKIRSTQ